MQQNDINNIVLTIATPDYAEQWRFCIDSQTLYCEREGYEHVVINPAAMKLHPKWCKIEIALSLIDNNNVLLIDADAKITTKCPSFMNILDAHPLHDIFFVNGISGRPNSGVLLLRGGSRTVAKNFLNDCLMNRETPVENEDFVTAEGENGHVISLLKLPSYKKRSIQLPIRWNCSDPDYADEAYILHYTNRLRAWLASQAGLPMTS